MSVVERDDELSQLQELGERTRVGRGQVVLITGPTASGRSTLLQTAAERLALEGMTVLCAVCAEPERTLDGDVLSQLVHSARLAPEIEGRLTAQLAAVVAAARSGTPGSRTDAALVQGIYAFCLLLQEAAAEQPLVIAVDDIRHADAVSIACLQQLMRRLRAQPVLLMITDDAEPAPEMLGFRAELDRQPQLCRIAVGPLSRDGVAAVLARRGHDTERADWFHAVTGGNPLLLNALTNTPTPDLSAYGQALVGCLHRVDPAVRRAAHAVALLDDDVALVPVSGLLGSEATVMARALRRLEAAGLLRRGRFRHAAARTAVLADIPDGQRAEWHHRAAELLYEVGACATTVARHVLDGGQPAPRWALPVLSEAAEHALAQGSTDHATTCLELALHSQPDARAAALLRVRLCQAEWEVNPSLAARRLPALQADLAAGRLDRHDGMDLIRQLLWHGRGAEAAGALAELRAATGDEEDLHHLEVWLAHTHPELSRRRPALATPIVGLPSRRADPWLPAAAGLAETAVRGQAAESATHARHVLRDLHIGRHTGWADEALINAVHVLAQADRLDSAAEWVDRLLDDAPVSQPPVWRSVLTVARADIALGQGDLTRAAEHARTALTVLAPKAWGVAVGLPLSILVSACARLGRTDEATAHLAQSFPDAMLTSRYGVRYLYARGEHHLAARHHHAALADFLACGELVRSWGLDASGVVPWRTGAAEAWLRLGNAEQARRLISGQLSRPGHHSARSRGPALRLLAATDPLTRRPQLLLESLELLESCGDRYEQARTLADLATAYHALHDDRRARMVFRRALHMAKVCEAVPLYRESQSVAGELGEGLADGETDRLTLLTGSERRVAALAAIGYTNREIANKLYITASTVEQHLTRVYRKLDVKDRRELPIEVAHRGANSTHAR